MLFFHSFCIKIDNPVFSQMFVCIPLPNHFLSPPFLLQLGYVPRVYTKFSYSSVVVPFYITLICCAEVSSTSVFRDELPSSPTPNLEDQVFLSFWLLPLDYQA
jgi:hypothetical protein